MSSSSPCPLFFQQKENKSDVTSVCGIVFFIIFSLIRRKARELMNLLFQKHQIYNITKNEIIGKCNSRVFIGLAITVYEHFNFCSWMCDWSKCVMWPHIPQLNSKLQVLQKKIWRIINTTASIWQENVLGYFLSLDMICSKPRLLEQIMSVDKYPSIFSCQMEAIVYHALQKGIKCTCIFSFFLGGGHFNLIFLLVSYIFEMS